MKLSHPTPVSSVVTTSGPVCTVSRGVVTCSGSYAQGGRGQRVRLPGDGAPLTTTGIQNAVLAASNGPTGCAALLTGEVWCWQHEQKVEGGKTVLIHTPPRPVVGVQGVVSLHPLGPTTGSADAMCAVLAAGGVKCWHADYGNRDFGEPDPVTGITPITGSADYVANDFRAPADTTVLSIEPFFTYCSVRRFGAIECELGGGFPKKTIATSATAVALSGYDCALLRGEHVQCWNSRNAGTPYPHDPAPVIGAHGEGQLNLLQPGGRSSLAAQADTVFKWAERVYPQYFTGNDITRSINNATVRLYAESWSKLFVNEMGTPHLYYMGPGTLGEVFDLGPLSVWQAEAGL